MNNIALLIIAAIGGLTGLVASLYLLISLPVVIVWKIYRRVTQGIPLTK